MSISNIENAFDISFFLTEIIKETRKNTRIVVAFLLIL